MFDKYGGMVTPRYGRSVITPAFAASNTLKSSSNSKGRYSDNPAQAPHSAQVHSSFQQKLLMNKVKAKEQDDRYINWITYPNFISILKFKCMFMYLFMPPDRMIGGILFLFCLSVCLSVCLFVCLSVCCQL